MRGLPSGPEQKTRKQVRQALQNEPTPETPDFHQQQYLTFRLNDQWYALSVYHLVEVLPPPKITRLPSVPDYILGVINLRGEILSTIDLKRFLGFPRGSVTEALRIIVVEQSGVRTGLLVDTSDPEAIARALERLADPLTRHRMGINGQRWILSHFSRATLGQRLREVLSTE